MQFHFSDIFKAKFNDVIDVKSITYYSYYLESRAPKLLEWFLFYEIGNAYTNFILRTSKIQKKIIFILLVLIWLPVAFFRNGIFTEYF